jgi:hypothetical protein
MVLLGMMVSHGLTGKNAGIVLNSSRSAMADTALPPSVRLGLNTAHLARRKDRYAENFPWTGGDATNCVKIILESLQDSRQTKT